MNKIILTNIFILIANFAFSEIWLPAIFSDNMVLQQNSDVKIWGKADKNSEITICTSWNNNEVKCKSDKNGNWQTTLKTTNYGGPFSLKISDGKEVVINNVLLGEVWLCSGQSNMEMPMKGFRAQPVENANRDIIRSKNDNIRLITVKRKTSAKPLDNIDGEWQTANPSSIADFSAVAYYFGKNINEVLDIPVGLIVSSWGGSCIQAWMSEKTSVDFEKTTIPKSDNDIKVPNRTPTTLFNGMINPIIGYSIKGVLWYQGETNYAEPDLYQTLFPTMVKEWRELWNIGEFPFLYAQIAPFDYKAFRTDKIIEKHNSAYIRDVQRRCEDIIPNSKMVVLMDVGAKENIHPAQKLEVGERFAWSALSNYYDFKGMSDRSPKITGFTINNGVVTVTIDEENIGIYSKVKEPQLFEIAGEDKTFHKANAIVRRKSILLSSPLVPNPVAVRYAFDDYVEAEIFNNAHLPLSSFRTDDW